MRRHLRWNNAAFFLLLVLFVSSLAAQPTIGSCPVFPANSIWNQPIDHLPVASNSATLVNSIGVGVTLHADFGSGTYQGAPLEYRL